MSKIINLFSGSGVGKSTMMADIFSQLKWYSINCEMAPEFAKEVVWESRPKPLHHQVYIFGKQYYRIARLIDEVDIIITDSPLPLSIVYKDDTLLDSFDKCVLDVFNQFDNINYFVKRLKEYNPKGRVQNYEEAKMIDLKVKNLLLTNNIKFTEVEGSPKGVDQIVDFILDEYYQ